MHTQFTQAQEADGGRAIEETLPKAKLRYVAFLERKCNHLHCLHLLNLTQLESTRVDCPKWPP